MAEAEAVAVLGPGLAEAAAEPDPVEAASAAGAAEYGQVLPHSSVRSHFPRPG